MAAINNQHIAKRYRTSSFRPSNKSAGFNTGFMSQFDQKPARSRRKKPASLFASVKQTVTKENRRLSQSSYKNQEKTRENERKSGFSFPVPSAATLMIAAGTVLIALTALKWEDISIKTPGKYIFPPVTSESTENHPFQLGSAASVIPDIIQVFQLPEKEQTAVAEAAKVEKVEKEAPVSKNTESEANNDLITFQWQQHKVQKGEVVSVIAKKFGISIGAIIASNNIQNVRKVREGTILRIPNVDGIPYIVRKGDSLTKIAASFDVPLEVILDINDIKSDLIKEGETIFIPGARMDDKDLKKSLGELFIYPVQKRGVTSYYGMRKDPKNGVMSFHNGIDLRASIGAPVVAVLDGTVSVVSENWLYGKYIILSHSNGYKTLYAHLNAYSVKHGDKVSQGKKIGEAGDTGYSTGAHLHFGIYDKNGKFVNPLDLLN